MSDDSEKFLAITDLLAAFQAQRFTVHVDFPLLQRLALSIQVGTARFPDIKIHDGRIIRLVEVLLYGGVHVTRWTAIPIHQTVLTSFHLSAHQYGLNQLRYDLRGAVLILADRLSEHLGTSEIGRGFSSGTSAVILLATMRDVGTISWPKLTTNPTKLRLTSLKRSGKNSWTCIPAPARSSEEVWKKPSPPTG